MKTIMHNRKRYRLSVRSYDGMVQIDGHGIHHLPLAGITLDSPISKLRSRVIEAIDRQRQCDKDAREMIQQRVKDGTAGIGGPL
jgi:hypothetical protein